MSGETNLREILRRLDPELLEEPFVFAKLDEQQVHLLEGLQPFAVVFEGGGTTVICKHRHTLAHTLEMSSLFACIHLTVHSSLNAVGLTAIVSQALANAQISANMVAGYLHDYIFVPYERRDEAMMILGNIPPG